MNQAFYLHSLQQIDVKMDRIDRRVAEIQKIIAADKTIARAKQGVDAAAAALDAARKSQAQADAAAHEIHMKIQLSETSLYGGKVRNPKELQDLQTEIKSHKTRLATLEDDQMAAMLAVEAAEAKLAQAEAAFNDAQAAAMTSNARLAAEVTSLSAERAQRLTERDAALATVRPESQALYQKLRSLSGGLAVAAVDETACAACGATLTPAERQKAKSPHELITCPSCGRILYAG